VIQDSDVIGEFWGIRAAMWAGAACMSLSWLPIFLSPLRREI
jgi:hypothetical protein